MGKTLALMQKCLRQTDTNGLLNAEKSPSRKLLYVRTCREMVNSNTHKLDNRFTKNVNANITSSVGSPGLGLSTSILHLTIRTFIRSPSLIPLEGIKF